MLKIIKNAIKYFLFTLAGLFFILPLFFLGAPFNASSRRKVQRMLNLADIKKGQKAVDLGSGDGRIIIALAQNGAEAYGYEINPFLVWIARRKIRKLGLEKNAHIYWKNFWREDLSVYDIVITFQIDISMPKLEVKLKNELKDGARVVSHFWPFPTWDYVKKKGRVYLYIVKN